MRVLIYVFCFFVAYVFAVKTFLDDDSAPIMKGVASGAWVLAAFGSLAFVIYNTSLYYDGVTSPELVWGLFASISGVILTVHPYIPLSIAVLSEERRE